MLLAMKTCEARYGDGVRPASEEPPLKGAPPVALGAKMDGQFFPLLFDPAL